MFCQIGKSLSCFLVFVFNKTLAVLTAVLAFFFEMDYSKVFNIIVISACGVPYFLANSFFIRQFFLHDIYGYVGRFDGYIYPYALFYVMIIYAIYTLIDLMKHLLLEKDFFNWYG